MKNKIIKLNVFHIEEVKSPKIGGNFNIKVFGSTKDGKGQVYEIHLKMSWWFVIIIRNILTKAVSGQIEQFQSLLK